MILYYCAEDEFATSEFPHAIKHSDSRQHTLEILDVSTIGMLGRQTK